jgi:hypothetical protein
MGNQNNQNIEMTIEQALQNLANATATVQADLNTHMVLQGSLAIVRKELDGHVALLAECRLSYELLKTENANLKERIESIYADDTKAPANTEEPGRVVS